MLGRGQYASMAGGIFLFYFIFQLHRTLYHGKMNSYHDCLCEKIKHYKRYIWFYLRHAIIWCSSSLHSEVINLANLGDLKYVILPNPSERTEYADSCTLVTLGVGGDIIAEKKLKKLQPNCKFFGAEPVDEMGAPYRQIGVYHEIAVSDKNGMVKGTIFLDNGLGIFSKQEVVSTVSLNKFLTEYVMEVFIDHLWIDTEGAEYHILPLLLSASLNKINITICQINVEIHRPFDAYNVTSALTDSLILQLLTGSDFVPIRSTLSGYLTDQTPPHMRVFFVNKGSVCSRKYAWDLMTSD